MSLSSGTQLFTYLGGSIDLALKAYVADSSSRVASALVAPLTTGLTIWLWSFGWGALWGRSQRLVGDVAAQALRASFVISIALAAGIYQGLVVDAAYGAADEWASLFGVAPDSGLYGNMDLMAQGGIDMGNKLVLRGMAELPFGGYVDMACGFMIVLEIALLILALGGLVLISHIGMALLLAVGPLFVATLLFRVTERLFFFWLCRLIDYVLRLGMLTFLTGLVLRIYGDYMRNANGIDISTVNALRQLFELSVLSGAILVVILHVPGLASSLSQLAAVGSFRDGVAPLQAGVARLTKALARSADRIAPHLRLAQSELAESIPLSTLLTARDRAAAWIRKARL